MSATQQYQDKIKDLLAKIDEQQQIVTAITTDPNYANIRNIVDLLARNGKNDGKTWYYTDTQSWVTGPNAVTEYNRWVPWLNQQDNALATAKSAIDQLNTQLKAVQTAQSNDSAVKSETDQALAKVNYAQGNVKYLIIGAVVITVATILFLLYLKSKKRA